MKIFVLFICLLHGILASNSTLMEYLEDRARTVDEELIRHGRKQDLYSVKLDDVNSVKLNGNYSSGEIFSFFRETYSVIDNEVYHISEKDCSKIERFLPQEKAVLFKSIEFGKIGFLMMATHSNILHVFGYSNDTKNFFKIQNIVHLNITDATFLENQQELYLMVSSYKSYDLTSIVVYKFVSTHFDETGKLLTSGATKLHSFSNNRSEIVVVLQKLGVTSSLFEFKSGQMRKLQKIDTQSPEEVLNYLYLGEQYVMVFSSRNRVILYLWTGTVLSKRKAFTTEFDLSGLKSVFYLKNTPYLIVVKDSGFVIFSVINDLFFQIHAESYTNWTKILSFKFLNDSNTFTALGKTENAVEARTVSISIEVSLQQTVIEEEKLSTCFVTLEKAAYVLRNKITEIENNTIVLRESMGESTQKGILGKKFELLLDKYFKIKHSRESVGEKKLVIDKSSVIDIPLGAKKIVAKNILFDYVNNEKWQPEGWLSYTKPQKISGQAKTQMMQTNELRTSDNETIFKNFLLSQSDQVLTGLVKVRNLTTTHLETKLINNVPVESLYFKSQPVLIQGLKSFPQLNVKNLHTGNINGVDATEVVTLLTNPNFTSNLNVNNLWVENINGVHFDNFRSSAFRVGHTDTIDGNLTFTNLQVTEMTLNTLSKMSGVLTTSTDQTITSSINIAKMYTKKVNTKTVNGVDFKNSVATLDNATINGPVIIKNLNVTKNLELQGNVDNEFLLFNDTHIVGTNESDFLQRYTGNLTIKGNLIVKNFDLGENAKLLVAGAQYDPKINKFWTKTSPQTIPVQFEAQNGVSTPYLLTNRINEININDYLLNSTDQKKNAKFYFDCVIVKGNVWLDENGQNSPDFEKIEKEAVKIDGKFNIKGRKMYTNILKVDRFEFRHLENQNISEMFSKNAPTSDSGSKQGIQNLVITGDLKSENVSVDKINNVNLRRFVENTVYIDKPQNLAQLNFENVTVQNLVITSTINGKRINELIKNLKTIYEAEKIHSVFISGGVNITNVENLSRINGQNVTKLLLKNNIRNNTVNGKVKFLGNLKVKELSIAIVNGVDLPNLVDRIFYKAWPQTITAPFTFSKLKTSNLTTEQINEFYIKNLIDVTSTKPQQIFVSDGIKMSDQVKVKNLFGDFGCDIPQSVRNLKMPPRQLLSNVVINGNVTFWDKETLANRIFEQALTRENITRVIKGEVNFRKHISANNITALENINDVDILRMINDAFLNKADVEQVITGKKVFSQLEAEDLVSLENTNVSEINAVNVMEIDSKIILKNSLISVPIKGQKVFIGGLQTKKIQTDLISGVEANNLVSFKSGRLIQQAMFESVTVTDNFNIILINGMPFETSLNERILRNSSKQILTGNYFFSKVIFNGNITTPQINDIKITDVVFDDGTQTILASKKFTKDLKIVGNITADFINGLKLSEAYEKAVLRSEDTNFTGVVKIMKPALMGGNIQTKYINSVPIEYMIDTNAKYSLETEAQKIHQITQIISSFAQKYLNTTKRMPTEIFYLEKLRDLQPLPNTIRAQIVETKDDILIHLDSEKDGTSCGLPQVCKCPMQQIMRISPEASINFFMNKALQRIYNYYSDDVIIHVITHSISTNSICRTSTSKVMNEISSLSWNVPPGENTTGGFHIQRAFYNGYISGVEFFTIYGRTYIVLGIYYDPVLDTHDLNTIVLRLNADKTDLEEIQRIPAKGMEKISLFPTAQGVVLIMASSMPGHFNSTSTQIFRFNEEKQQFQLLREVPMFGTLQAEGVVLEMDSLIILANKFSTIILKYQSDFDNYYLYQTFQLDYPVTSMSVFYAQGFGISDAYLSVVTTNNEYFIYSFWFIEGWKLEFSGKLDGVRILVPFTLKGKSYLFAPSDKTSSLLTLVEHDSN